MKQFCLGMRRRPSHWAFGAFWSFVSCVGQTSPPTGGLAPHPATSPAAVNQPFFSHSNVLDQRIAFWQTRVTLDPDYWGSYNQLAAAYAQKARETGDVEYLALAENALKQSLKLESSHVEAAPAFSQLATVHLAEHRFSEAYKDAEASITLQAGNLIAYTYAGDAQLELGNYAQSRSFYDKLVTPSDGFSHSGIEFLAASHGANLSWLEGDTERATKQLKSAIALSMKLHLPAENSAWTEFMLGEQFFQMGDLNSAEKEETASLELFPRYHRALAAMAQIRAAQGRLQEAISFYKEAIAIIPLPLYLGALGDAYAALGDKVNAEKQYSVVEFIGKLNAINQQVYNRELALFYADHDRKLQEALILSRKELESRQDIYTSDALAWALLKNGQAAAAHDEMEKALRLGTQDAMLEYHAGMIDSALGHKAEAVHHLQRALQINPHFHVIFAGQAAKMLASLADNGIPDKSSRVEKCDGNQK